MMPTTIRSVEDLDFDALLAAAAKEDELVGLTDWEPDNADDSDPRSVTAVEDAIKAFEKSHSESAEKRLFKLADNLLDVDAPVATDDLDGPRPTMVLDTGTINLALSKKAATALLDAIDLIAAQSDFLEGKDEDVLQAISAELSSQLEGW